MVFSKFEERLGLPPLKDMAALLSGPTGKRLESIVNKLNSLHKDTSSIKEMVTLLKLVKELDDNGTIERLTELLKEIKPLSKSKLGAALLEKFDKFEKMLTALLKDDTSS